MFRALFRLPVLSVIALVVVACRQDAPATLPSNRAPAPAATVAISDVLGYLPLDSELVLGLDIKALRKAPLWAEYRATIVAALGSRLTDVQRTCGFDPIEAIDSFTLGMFANSTPRGALVIRGLDRERTLACLATPLFSDKVTNENGLITLTSADGTIDMMTFVDRTTLVMQGSGKKTSAVAKAELAAVLAGGTPLRGSPGFLAMYDRLEPNATMWGVVRLRDGGISFGKYASSLGGEPRAAFGTFRISDGLDATVRIRMDTADLASQVTTKMQGQLNPGALFGTFGARAERYRRGHHRGDDGRADPQHRCDGDVDAGQRERALMMRLRRRLHDRRRAAAAPPRVRG